MKFFILIIGLLITSNVFATSGFECSTQDNKITIFGTVGTGDTLLEDVYVKHTDLQGTVTLELSMRWFNRDNGEIKARSYNAMDDVTRLNLEVENGKGKLYLNLFDMVNGYDIPVTKALVTCIIE